MNICRAAKIPPLLVNKCKPNVNSSVLPELNFLTEKRINHITIGNDEIISLIRKIKPWEATGSDEISGQLLIFCDDSVILPLKLIFNNI